MKQITVFSTPTCVYCNLVKKYMSDKNLSYKEVDVSKDDTAKEAMVAKSGTLGVPQIWIDSHVVVGFNKGALDQLLKD